MFAWRFVTFCTLLVKTQHFISKAFFIVGMTNKLEVDHPVIPTEWKHNVRLEDEAQMDIVTVKLLHCSLSDRKSGGIGIFSLEKSKKIYFLLFKINTFELVIILPTF